MALNEAQPFLRWAGSKRQLLPTLEKYWNTAYDRYVEPFAGSACLFFRLRPERALLSDVNSELIDTYTAIREDVESVVSSLAVLQKGRAEYYTLRETDPGSLPKGDRAARFIYLNRFCFNGLYRTNLAGMFNVPYGGDKAGNLPTSEALRKVARLLNGAEMITGDFAVALEKARAGDFVYMDPPFRVASRRVFREYDSTVFGVEDLVRLRQWMMALAEKDISFLVSYAECEEADFLKDGFYVETVTVRRNIAGFAGNRGKAREVLISSRPPPDRKEVTKCE